MTGSKKLVLPKTIRAIDVITMTSQALIDLEEKLGIKADISSFAFIPGDDGVPIAMNLNIDGAHLISSTIPPHIEKWHPARVARTVLTPIYSLLASI